MTPGELVTVGDIISSVVTRVQTVCGDHRVSASLSIAHTTMTGET